MRTITLSILDSEEEAVMRQIYEWNRRRAVRLESIDPLLLLGTALTPDQWVAELHRAEASGEITLTKDEARARFGL